MGDFDVQLDEAEVILKHFIYCAKCMLPMNPLSSNAFVCAKCGFEYKEK